MLTTSQLSVSIDGTPIIHSLDTRFQTGTTTAILGHNGSWKSSFALTLMGHPRYRVAGSIFFDEMDISAFSPTDRYIVGMFISFQNIPEIPGIKVSEYLRTVYNTSFARNNPGTKLPTLFVWRRMIEKLLPPLGLESSILDRDLFVGFSGGEKRRIELLQISLLDPKLIILDEIDSGLDIDAIEILRQQISLWQEQKKTIILISHNFQLLKSIRIDGVMVMKDGTIANQWAGELLEQIQIEGFR